MIFIIAGFFVAFLVGLISEDRNAFSWSSFLFTFILIAVLFAGLGYVFVYHGKGDINASFDQLKINKISETEDGEIYLSAVYQGDKIVGHEVLTSDNGFQFLDINSRVEIVQDGKNYVHTHTRIKGGFWWALFYSNEVVDYYEVHIPTGPIMYRKK
jgi:hypothetical protein